VLPKTKKKKRKKEKKKEKERREKSPSWASGLGRYSTPKGNSLLSFQPFLPQEPALAPSATPIFCVLWSDHCGCSGA
jgi:hypothetical protein